MLGGNKLHLSNFVVICEVNDLKVFSHVRWLQLIDSKNYLSQEANDMFRCGQVNMLEHKD